mmetsp:Transcript_19479/g.29289  ORF Transcript_19479/g.29289 Transcript_19479/m.29289 type:complete len:736 (+) Transcript_19479:83-2290(+)
MFIHRERRDHFVIIATCCTCLLSLLCSYQWLLGVSQDSAHTPFVSGLGAQPLLSNRNKTKIAKNDNGRKKRKKLSWVDHPRPNWRIVFDCSAFDRMCVSAKPFQYAKYPFNFHENISNSNMSWKESLSWKISNKKVQLRYQNLNDTFLLLNDYPAIISKDSYENCLSQTLKVDYGTQLETMLKRLDRRPLDLIAFTISDYDYAHDMIHDVFQMSWELLEFHNAFFMVALDFQTVELACRYGYPVIAPPAILQRDSNSDVSKISNSTKSPSLHDRVQLTKFLVSRDLVRRRVNYLFYEMDIWWIRSSPLYYLMPKGDQTRWEKTDILVSAHQDQPYLSNIGVYLVHANNRTEEFFSLCYQLLANHPKTFDQFVFHEVWELSVSTGIAVENNESTRDLYSFDQHPRQWKPKPPATPSLNYPLKYAYRWDSNLIAAQEFPIVTEDTLAIHPLSSAPLSNPHGKKIIAKELGAWYGFHSPSAEFAAGYYQRSGTRNRRYLMLDSKTLGAYSMIETAGTKWGYWHSVRSLQWTLAILVVLARQMSRILILPKLVMDRHAMFLWTGVDLKSIDGLVEVRETNFFHNVKSRTDPNVEIDTAVARTALVFIGEKFKMFGIPAGSAASEPNIERYQFHHNSTPVDFWYKFLTLTPGYDDAELLLVYPQFVTTMANKVFLRPGVPPSALVTQIYDVAQHHLKFCVTDNDVWKHFDKMGPASGVKSGDDCYGRGELLPHLRRKVPN